MGFPEDLWDSFGAVCERVQDTKDYTEEVVTFFKKLAELERDYAKRLSSLTRGKEQEIGTLGEAWTRIKQELDATAARHTQFADTVTGQCHDPLQTWLKDSARPRKTHKANGTRLQKDLQSAEQNMLKKKAGYEQARKQQDKTQDEYEKATFNNSTAPQVSKLAKKLHADTQKAEAADLEYNKAVQLTQELQAKNYDSELPRILGELELMEENRMQATRASYTSFSDALAAIGPDISSCAARVKSSVDGIHPREDINAYVASKRTGAAKPARAEYEPYDKEIGACRPGAPSGGGGGGGSGVISSPRDHLPSSASTSPRPLGATPIRTATTASIYSSPSGGGGGSTASTYHSSPPPSLNTPVRTGTVAVGAGASVGRGASAAAAATAASASANGKAIGRARALYDYEATDDGELSFKKDDIINILQKDESGWWQGELRGVVGVFPSRDWVEEIAGSASPSSAAAVAPPPPPREDPTNNNKSALPKKVKALYAYTAENEYELTMNEGDILDVESLDEDGWYTGRNPRGGHGRFPSNYTSPNLNA